MAKRDNSRRKSLPHDVSWENSQSAEFKWKNNVMHRVVINWNEKINFTCKDEHSQISLKSLLAGKSLGKSSHFPRAILSRHKKDEISSDFSPAKDSQLSRSFSLAKPQLSYDRIFSYFNFVSFCLLFGYLESFSETLLIYYRDLIF